MREEVSLFPVDERILELARLLIVPGAIPEKAGPDAVHIAAAAVEECEFLLTWNFRQGYWRVMATQKRPSAPRKSWCEEKLWEDEVLHEVYAARDAYAAEHGYDLDRIYADLKSRETISLLRRAPKIT